MTLYIWQNGQQFDVSLAVVKGTLRCRKTLSMDFDKAFGEGTLEFNLYDDFVTEGVRFKPRSGQRVRFVLDDGTDLIYFDGFLKDPGQASAGFSDVAQRLAYKCTAEDLTTLFHKKIMPEKTFKPEDFNISPANFNAGTLIDYLAAYCDQRILPATGNDVGYSISQSKKTARMNIYQAIEEIAKDSGLLVWVDEEYKIHHKLYATICGLVQLEKFNITDTAATYVNLDIQEDNSKLCTRVHVIGSEMDAGTLQPQNRKQGKQKRQERIVTRTGTLDQINYVRRNLGYAELAPGTDPTTLASSEPGIIEKDIPFQDAYNVTIMERRGDIELATYGDPWLKGTVSFYAGGLVVGRSIPIVSTIRGWSTALPVIELELSTSQGSGFDSDSNHQYLYTASLNGPSKITQLLQDMKPLAAKEAKAELLIKPKPMVFKSHKTTEANPVLTSVTGVIVTRSEKTY